MKIQSRLLPFYALICALLWGTAFPAIKYVYRIWPESQQWDSRMLFAGIRFMVAGLILMPLVRRGGLLKQLKKANLRLLLALALTQTFAQYLFFYMGLSLSSGVLGALMISCGSFWWILLSPLLLKTPKPDAHHWAMLLFCALGIVVAVYKPGIGSGSPLLGALCFLAATLNGALGLIILKPLHRTLDSATATAFSLFIGGVLLVTAGSRALPELGVFLNPRLAGMTLYLAFVSAAAFVLWNRLAREFSINILAGYRFLIPLAGITLSSLLIPNEKPGTGIYLGAVLILGSLFYVNYVDRKSTVS
ncbi:MAG: DMT family transporter [Verrucomicrobiota bacterium]